MTQPVAWLRSTCARGALALAIAPLAALPALAQPAAGGGQASDNGAVGEIVVTGSRLGATAGLTAPTPVSVIGGDRLQERAATNIGDALNELPAFRATQTPSAGELGPPAGYVAGRILDLRGLGGNRTLTLLDGKRFVPSTTQATVDTNMIPSILLQRAEVVTGGASAQYGSDAVAGVVNMILDKKLEGVKGQAQYGQTKYGDNRDYQAGLAFGVKIGDKGHLVIGGDYEKDKGIGDCFQRDWCATETLNFGRNPGVTNIVATQVVPHVRPWTALYNGAIVPPNTAYNGQIFPTLRPFEGITFNNDGTPRRLGLGTAANNLYQVGGEGFGNNIYFQNLFLVAPNERYAITGNLNYEVTPDITANLMINVGHLTGEYSQGTYRNTAITIQANNPFIPTSTDPSLNIPTLLQQAGATSFLLGKGFEELGRVPLITRNNVFRAVFSLEGKIPSTGDWNWDAYYEFGKNRFKNTFTNQAITSRLTNALQAVRNPAGQIVCGINADANPANDDPACVAYNPFGQVASAAAKSYVTANGFQTNNTTENVVAANLRGTLVQFPYGPFAIATGGEFRSDKVDGDADPLSKAGAFWAGNGQKIAGQIKVVEGYVEGEMPLLRGINFANELSLNGAIRRTHYDRSNPTTGSSTVNVTTWKYGGVWEPTEAIRFRATRSRDIRAPNVSELFGPTTSGQSILTDYLRGGLQTVGGTVNGSNPNLLPEVADTFTAGIVLKPVGGILGRFHASADYYNIKIHNAISTLGVQNIILRCFQGDAFSCSLITRDALGTPTVRDTQQNVNEVINRGIDFEVGYRQPLGDYGNLTFRGLATRVIDFITIDAVGPTQRAGQTGLRGGTPAGLPDWTLDGLFTWNYKAFQLSTHVRYINKGIYYVAFVGPDQPGYSVSATNSVNDNHMPSRTYVDLMGEYRIDYGPARRLTVYGGVDNLTNASPPLTPGSHGTGNDILFSPIGTTFKAGVRFNY